MRYGDIQEPMPHRPLSIIDMFRNHS
ncbi:uncharacterized protein METZ01_LOCUS174869, partial [marine metagenome]